jgi:hypothetical protein
MNPAMGRPRARRLPWIASAAADCDPETVSAAQGAAVPPVELAAHTACPIPSPAKPVDLPWGERPGPSLPRYERQGRATL